MLDPSIPLSFKSPEFQNPLETMSKLQAYKNAQQQSQMGAIELQQAKQAQQDDQTMRRIMGKHGGDIETALPELAGSGISPKLYIDAQNRWFEQQKNKLAVQESQQKVAEGIHESMGKFALGVHMAGDTPEAFNSMVDTYSKAYPFLSSQIATYVKRAQQDPTSIKAMMDEIQAGTTVGQKEREVKAAEQTAESRKMTAETGRQKFALEMPSIVAKNLLTGLDVAGRTIDQVSNQQEYTEFLNGLDPAVRAKLPPMYSPSAVAKIKQAAIPVEQAASQAETRRHNVATEGATATGQAETRRHNVIEEQQGAGRLGVERENAARMQRQYDATYGALLGPNGEQLSPEAQKAMAQQDPMAAAVANYQLPPPSAGRSGPGAAVLRKVMAINPTYDAKNWQSQSAMMKGYTSGSQSKEIGGINTALGHVGVLGDAIDALNNGNLQALNRIANYFSVQTGGDPVTTYKSIVHKLAPEINRAYVGGTGTQEEIKAQESDFDPALGDKQLRSNVAKTAQLMRSKMGSLENQWQQTMGSDFESKFIMPEAKAVADKWAPRPAGTQPQQQQGAPRQQQQGQQAPQLPQRLSAADVGKIYFSPKTGKTVKITAVNPNDPTQFKSEVVQ